MSDEPQRPASPGASPLRRPAVELLLASAVVLFFELVLIRWLASKVRVMAFFPNVVLIAAFLGLGLGSLRAGKRSLLWLWPASLIVLVAGAIGGSRIVFTQESSSEHLWLLYYDLGQDAPVIDSVVLPIVILFVLVAASFIPLGQLVAERLQRFRERDATLWGYAFDLGGSLIGIVAFTLVSWSGAFPVVWFVIALAAGAGLFLASGRKLLAAHLAAGVVAVVAVGLSESAELYSPYYALTASTSERGTVQVGANGSLHQVAFAAGKEGPDDNDWIRHTREGYHSPYVILDRPIGKALVLGAGTGNDVATLLARGAERVDAIEIDPELIAIGRRLHPDQPYGSDRVRAINTDARSWLNDTEERYDLIVFGTLDSMTRLSAVSSVRLDNFVYTRECVEAAARCLTDDGGIVMYFMVDYDGHGYIARRLLTMLGETFDQLPLVQQKGYFLFNTVFMAGPAFAHISPAERTLDRAEAAAITPSDDWPYLYLEERGLSGFYLSLIAAFAAIAIVAVGVTGGRELASRADPEMFLYGVAFLLLETKSVTEMNLLWGATWLASAAVFGSVLLMILLATILAAIRPIPFWLAMPALLVSLVIAYVVPIQPFVSDQWIVKLGASLLLVGLPIGISATCFAARFATRKHIEAAFGWNLLGAVFGGLTELLSMLVGLKALTLLALAAYLATWPLVGRGAQGSGGPPPAPGHDSLV